MNNTEFEELSTEMDKLREEGVIEKAVVSLDDKGRTIKNSFKLIIKESNVGEFSRSIQKQGVPKVLSILHKNNAIAKNSNITLSLIEDELVLSEIEFEVVKDNMTISDFLKSEENYLCELGLTLKEFLKDFPPNETHLFTILPTPEGRVLYFVEAKGRYILANRRVDASNIAKKAKSRVEINKLKNMLRKTFFRSSSI